MYWKKLNSVYIFTFLFIVILLLYYPTIFNTFVLDDYVWIEPLTIDKIKNIFTGTWEHGNTLRPIMRLFWGLERILFGENPTLWHLTNILLHTSISFSLYLIIKKIIKNKWLAIIGAFIFAIFPIHHENVAWISGQTHPLGLLLTLLAGYLLYKGIIKNKKYIILGYVLMLLSFLTYEISFTIPIALLLTILIIGPKNKTAYLVTTGSFALLFSLLFYRYIVLDGSIGSVGSQHNNILLAPFLNIYELKNLYWYCKEVKLPMILISILLFCTGIKNKIWKNRDKELYLTILLFFFSILSYLPFSIVDGVAVRFLYTTTFFSTITLVVFYDYLSKIKTSKIINTTLVILLLLVTTFSLNRTWKVSNIYKEIADSYSKIQQTVIADFPMWPEGKHMLFYNIPDGIPDGKKDILAYLTYFGKAVKYNYQDQQTGHVYRAERLSEERLNKILNNDPIIYKFENLNSGIRKISKESL